MPVPPKPAEAAAEFNRPPRDQRAKLLDIVEMGIGNNAIPSWLDGGKRLLLVSEGRESSAPGKPVTVAGVELVKGFGTSHAFLGLTAKGEQWVEYVAKEWGGAVRGERAGRVVPREPETRAGFSGEWHPRRRASDRVRVPRTVLQPDPAELGAGVCLSVE